MCEKITKKRIFYFGNDKMTFKEFPKFEIVPFEGVFRNDVDAVIISMIDIQMLERLLLLFKDSPYCIYIWTDTYEESYVEKILSRLYMYTKFQYKYIEGSDYMASISYDQICVAPHHTLFSIVR